MSETSFSINYDLRNRFSALSESLKTEEQALYQQAAAKAKEMQQQEAFLDRARDILHLQKGCLEKMVEGEIPAEIIQAQYQEKLAAFYKQFASLHEVYLKAHVVDSMERKIMMEDYERTVLAPEQAQYQFFSFKGETSTKLSLVEKRLEQISEKYFRLNEQRTQWVDENVETPAAALKREKKDLKEYHELQAKEDIWRAAAEGDSAKCLQLLKAHPDKLNALSGEGRTPLQLACLNGQLETVKLLLAQKKIEPLKKDTDRGFTALHYAMKNKKPNTKEILNCFPPINLQTVLGKHQETLLHVAARNNNVLGAQWLLAQGFTQLEARLDNKNCRWTALHLAASYGQTEMVRYLITQGANVRALSSRGGSPLAEALAILHEPAATAFLEQGVWLSHQEQEELFKSKNSTAIKTLMARILEREKVRLEGSLVFSSLSTSSSSSSSSSSTSSSSLASSHTASVSSDSSSSYSTSSYKS